MNFCDLNIDPEELEPTGDFNPTDPSPDNTRLSCSVRLLGGYCHLDLIQVIRKHPHIAVNSELQKDLDALDVFNEGETMVPVKVNGRYYIPIMSPFCQ